MEKCLSNSFHIWKNTNHRPFMQFSVPMELHEKVVWLAFLVNPGFLSFIWTTCRLLWTDLQSLSWKKCATIRNLGKKGELIVIWATTHVTFHALRSAVFIICSFMRYKACPKRIKFDFGNQTITKAMHVERQLHLKSSQRFREPQIFVFLPAVTSYFDAFRPSFLVEYFEYQRLAGVKKIHRRNS